MWACRYVWLAVAKMAQGSKVSRAVWTGFCMYFCDDTHASDPHKLSHNTQIKTVELQVEDKQKNWNRFSIAILGACKPIMLKSKKHESWILPKEMLHFLFFQPQTKKLSMMRKLNPLVQNEGWKKIKINKKKMGVLLLLTYEQHRRCEMPAKWRLS
jgi:hypothetical protein